MIFNHGLLLSQKFFADNSPIMQKYRRKVKKKVKGPKNFVEMNKKLTHSSSDRGFIMRRMTPNVNSIRKRSRMSAYVNINTPGPEKSHKSPKKNSKLSETRFSQSPVEFRPLMQSNPTSNSK